MILSTIPIQEEASFDQSDFLQGAHSRRETNKRSNITLEICGEKQLSNDCGNGENKLIAPTDCNRYRN